MNPSTQWKWHVVKQRAKSPRTGMISGLKNFLFCSLDRMGKIEFSQNRRNMKEMAFSPGVVLRTPLIPLPVLTVVIPLSKIPLSCAQMILYDDRHSIVPST